MAGTENIYRGSGFGIDPTYGLAENYGESFLGFSYRYPASQFGFPSDPRTANQLDAVSKKISTGAKTIEVSGVNITGGGPMKLIDSIPKQQFKEIQRLKKLTGVDLTFHGPLVEATGFQGRQGWTEAERKEAERQMLSAVERSHELDPNGNLVITFHSSNGLPDPQTTTINEQGEKEITNFFVVDEYRGQFGSLPIKTSHLEGIDKSKPEEYIKKENENNWGELLESIGFYVRRGSEAIEELKTDERAKDFLKLYSKLGTPEGNKILDTLEKEGIDKRYMNRMINAINFGDLEFRRAYQQFKDAYDRAYDAAEKSDNQEELGKLNQFREELKPKLNLIKDPEKIDILAEELQKGIQVLRTVQPKLLRPLREWAIDKAGETFANVAFESYKKFKDNSPIISIENPPAGSGLSRAEDLRDLVEEARKKFIENATQNLGLSKSEAKEQAEKLIGVTWDVGHINMLRGHGYKEKDIIKQTEEIAKYVKHVHLSDNFGLEHTELPMGMGNVTTEEHLELIDKYNKQVKKIVETGDWFQPFKTTPFRETLSAFGSSVYGMDSPYWNQTAYRSGGYFVGQGIINPEVHHATFGAGFSNLPIELGGQMAGRSRASGAPIE